MPNLRYFSQPDILLKIGCRRLAKLLKPFSEELKPLNLPKPPPPDEEDNLYPPALAAAAPNTSKQLRITFSHHGRQQTIEVSEGRELTLPSSARVTEALYEDLRAPGSRKARAVDLTEKLAGLIKDNRLSVRIDNTLAGGDPAWLKPKELHLEYSLAGQVKHGVIGENEMLTLPEDEASLGLAPAFAFGSDTEGRTRFLAWTPGTLNLGWASGRESKAECLSLPAPLALAGPCEVHFPPGWGAPEHLTFARLHSWPEDDNTGVKYFSGTATYLKQFNVPADLVTTNLELWLDLGVVKNLAEVSLNGQSLGILWKPPFRVNVTAAARAGVNRLELKVTNLWPNHLIGDEQSPPDCEWNGKQLKNWPAWLLEGRTSPTGRLTLTTWHHWKKGDPLLESGLLGPVVLKPAKPIDL